MISAVIQDCFNINKGVSNVLDLSLFSNDLPYKTLAVNKAYLNNIDAFISFDYYHEAPINPNTVIGRLDFNVNGATYFSMNIINTNSVCRRSVFDYLNIMLSNYCSYFDSLLSFI